MYCTPTYLHAPSLDPRCAPLGTHVDILLSSGLQFETHLLSSKFEPSSRLKDQRRITVQSPSSLFPKYRQRRLTRLTESNLRNNSKKSKENKAQIRASVRS